MRAEPTACIISAGTRKIPLPIMVPTTIAVECQAFNSRSSSGAALGALCIGFGLQKTCQISHNKRGDGTKRYVPGPGNVGPSPDINVESQSAEHTSNCAILGGATRKQAKQEHTQQPAIGQRSDGEALLQYVAAIARSQRQSEESEAPDDSGNAGKPE